MILNNINIKSMLNYIDFFCTKIVFSEIKLIKIIKLKTDFDRIIHKNYVKIIKNIT